MLCIYPFFVITTSKKIKNTRTASLFETTLVLETRLYVFMERVMRIELTTSAWKAEVLPLNYTRILYCPASPPWYSRSLRCPFEVDDFRRCPSSACRTKTVGSAYRTGLAGFEPTHDGVKVRCLTAWL